jgi:hypothetical protein
MAMCYLYLIYDPTDEESGQLKDPLEASISSMGILGSGYSDGYYIHESTRAKGLDWREICSRAKATESWPISSRF